MILFFFIAIFILVYIAGDYLYTYFTQGRVQIAKSDSGRSIPFYFTPRKPVSWFDFIGLFAAFTKISNSSNTLAIIDKREVEAGFHKEFHEGLLAPHQKEYWFDFMADTGDGYNSTTSVFYALTREKLKLPIDKNLSNVLKEKEIETKRGSLLIIGGDLVYPEASDENYVDRFKGPLRTVFPDFQGAKEDQPFMIATPGNHDWYDGLNAFFRMMCQGKRIGGYKTIQNKSYFGYSIKENLHIIGLDNQLMGDIDIPQVHYFDTFIENLGAKDKSHTAILVIAEPYWYGYDLKERYMRRQRMDSLEYIIHRIRKTANQSGIAKLDVRVVMTGDIHHYSRYECAPNDSETRFLLTSGGGGAFKHMTHKLSPHISIPKLGDFTPEDSVSYELKNQYYDQQVSRRRNILNLLFPIPNFKFTALIFGIFTIPYSIFHTTDISGSNFLLMLIIPLFYTFTLSKVESPERSNRSIAHFKISIFVLVLILLVFQTYVLYSPHIWLKKMDVFLFGIAEQFHAIYAETAYRNAVWDKIEVIATCSLLSAGASLIFGWYLAIQFKFFGKNITEASSSNVVEGYNQFIRCCVTENTLKFYVIAVEKAYYWHQIVRQFDKNEILRKEFENDMKDIDYQYVLEKYFDRSHSPYLNWYYRLKMKITNRAYHPYDLRVVDMFEVPY